MRARISVSLLLVCLSLGCGSSGELAPDAGAEGGAPDGTDAASEEDVVGAGFCTPGADQTCNDDPSVSALEGTCHRLGFCECNEGYSLNWNTNRCRVGTECVASAADDWQYRMPLDAADCASRAPTACSNGTSLLTSDVDSLMSTTCRLPNDLWIRIELADGCPTLLEATHRGKTALDDDETQFLSCFAPLLAAKRFSCATSTCLLEARILLP